VTNEQPIAELEELVHHSSVTMASMVATMTNLLAAQKDLTEIVDVLSDELVGLRRELAARDMTAARADGHASMVRGTAG